VRRRGKDNMGCQEEEDCEQRNPGEAE